MRKKIIAGNWKMNINHLEAEKLLEDLVKCDIKDNHEVIVFPPFTSIPAALKVALNSEIRVGAQNISQYENGAYTGEISSDMLLTLGVRDVIVGHSERREIFKEDNEIVRDKAKKALEDGFHVILCLGENQEIRDRNKEEDFVKNQLINSLKNIDIRGKNITLAYEPIWAIGTGKTCSGEDAEKMCFFIRKTIKELYGEDEASLIRILYGGSVKAENISDLMARDNIDGVLVGGASLKSESFKKLINYEV